MVIAGYTTPRTVGFIRFGQIITFKLHYMFRMFFGGMKGSIKWTKWVGCKLRNIFQNTGSQNWHHHLWGSKNCENNTNISMSKGHLLHAFLWQKSQKWYKQHMYRWITSRHIVFNLHPIHNMNIFPNMPGNDQTMELSIYAIFPYK